MTFGSEHVSLSSSQTLSAALNQGGRFEFEIRQKKLFSMPLWYVSFKSRIFNTLQLQTEAKKSIQYLKLFLLFIEHIENPERVVIGKNKLFSPGYFVYEDIIFKRKMIDITKVSGPTYPFTIDPSRNPECMTVAYKGRVTYIIDPFICGQYSDKVPITNSGPTKGLCTCYSNIPDPMISDYWCSSIDDISLDFTSILVPDSEVF